MMEDDAEDLLKRAYDSLLLVVNARPEVSGHTVRKLLLKSIEEYFGWPSQEQPQQ